MKQPYKRHLWYNTLWSLHVVREMSHEIPSPQTGKLTSIICRNRIHQKRCGLIDTDTFREGNTLCSSYSLQAIAFIMI